MTLEDDDICRVIVEIENSPPLSTEEAFVVTMPADFGRASAERVLKRGAFENFYRDAVLFFLDIDKSFFS